MKIKAVQKAKFPVVGFVNYSTGVAALSSASEGKSWSIWRSTPIGAHGLNSYSQAAGHCGEPEVEGYEAHQEAQGDMGSLPILSTEISAWGGLLRASSFKGLSRK